MEPVTIRSRENPFFKELQKLSQDNTAYRKSGRVWAEGEHLCSAALLRGVRPEVGVYAESFWPQVPAAWLTAAAKNVRLPDALWRGVSQLESPARVGFVFQLAPQADIQPGVATVVLDRVQDAGNVGSILRSAAAFGFSQVVAIKGTAALWSAKVLRAGMGAHFGLQLIEGMDAVSLHALQVPLVVTSSHQGDFIQNIQLPRPCAWVMGHEGQGVAPDILALACHKVRIAQPGGEESLNVAAAAAICLHASSLV